MPAAPSGTGTGGTSGGTSGSGLGGSTTGPTTPPGAQSPPTGQAPAADPNEPYLPVYWFSTVEALNTLSQEGILIAGGGVIFSDGLGEYRRSGPADYERDPNLFTRHLDEIRRELRVHMGSTASTYNGLAVFDYEAWWPYWDACTEEIKNNWRSFVTGERPQYLVGVPADQHEATFESTFNVVARRFFEATFAAAREIVPNAKWGMYGLPFRDYFVFLSTETRINQYTQSHAEEPVWLWELQDVFFPSLYAFYPITDQARRPLGYAFPEENEAYNRGMLTLANRARQLGGTEKPVIPFITPFYHESNTRIAPWTTLNRSDVEQVLRLSRDLGADGIIVWAALHGPYRQYIPAVTQWWNTIVHPELEKVQFPSRFGLPAPGQAPGN